MRYRPGGTCAAPAAAKFETDRAHVKRTSSASWPPKSGFVVSAVLYLSGLDSSPRSPVATALMANLMGLWAHALRRPAAPPPKPSAATRISTSCAAVSRMLRVWNGFVSWRPVPYGPNCMVPSTKVWLTLSEPPSRRATIIAFLRRSRPDLPSKQNSRNKPRSPPGFALSTKSNEPASPRASTETGARAMLTSRKPLTSTLNVASSTASTVCARVKFSSRKAGTSSSTARML
mmetsp:Transcript_1942/g.6389  ORF Transcript_1942/g.6389 Transcript_1942/m.6389 type:complete len:232 (+) Transcript_1942:923-1618(+)